jgi:hypothetical protein
MTNAVILWLSLLLVALASKTAVAKEDAKGNEEANEVYQDAGAVVYRFNQLLNDYLEYPTLVNEVLAETAVGCFNGECGPALDMYAGFLSGGATVFMYQTEYFSVTPKHVVMRSWNYMQYASNCMTMFYSDSVVTVENGTIVRHEIYVDDDQLALFLFCNPPGEEEEEQVNKDGNKDKKQKSEL